MRIGLDFDNTIACYDGVFFKAARDRGLVPANIGSSKNEVRDYLNGRGDKDAFTELQGYVYGTRMDLAKPYDGIQAFVELAIESQHEVFIVSHKSRYPILGARHDLHVAARAFLSAHGLTGAGRIALDNVFFEATKEDKIARAAALEVDVFVDDLPEILSMPGLPDTVQRYLFDPHAKLDPPASCTRVKNWQEAAGLILEGHGAV